MKVKDIQRTAQIAWSPLEQHPIQIVAATAAQQLDASFSTAAAIEIFSLNLPDSSQAVQLRGSLESESRFHKLIWSPHNPDNEHPCGVIAGGSDGGKLQMWSADSIIKNQPALLFESTKHVGPVQSLDFNCFQTNLIASGASQSEIFIWDLNKPDNPMTPGTKNQPCDEVYCVAWNKQVQHIMASTLNNHCIVWDLRKSEPIIKITESMSQMKSKLLCWHPEIATQMILTSEDDHSPVMQLWDLRFAASSLKILESHQRGILSCAWCKEDPELLLSCGKDNRILCWNVASSSPNGEVVFELPTSKQWTYDVQWCPRNPSIISSCSFDGHIGIFSILGGESTDTVTHRVADSFPLDRLHSDGSFPKSTGEKWSCRIPLQKPPRWLRRPVAAHFGFGGKLVSFEKSEESGVVTLSRISIESKFLARVQQFERAVNDGNLQSFCESKIRCDEQLCVWNFLAAQFDNEPRHRYLNILGYNVDNFDEKMHQFILSSEGSQVVRNGLESEVDSQKLSSNQPEPISRTTESSSVDEPLFLGGDAQDVDSMINLAIITGRLEEGVRLCRQAGRWPEAMIIAAAVSSDLLTTTQLLYLNNANEPHLLVSCLVQGELEKLVQICHIDSWKEILSIILTRTSSDKCVVLCEALGGRLETSEEHCSYAVLCYICAGSIDNILRVMTTSRNNLGPDELEDLVEKVIVLQECLASQSRPFSHCRLSDILCKYAELLASEGMLRSALYYLQSCSHDYDQLADRVRKALGLESEHDIFTDGSTVPYSLQKSELRNTYSSDDASSQLDTHFGSMQQAYLIPSQGHHLPPSVDPHYSSSTFINSRNTQPAAPANQYVGYSHTSYQQTKPFSAWNDPPPVTRKALMKTATQICTKAIYNPSSASVERSTVYASFGATSDDLATNESKFHRPDPSLEKQVLHVEDKSHAAADIPPEHQFLQSTFHTLATKCGQVSCNPHSKRKLDDVSKKLENLYNKLRLNALSDNSLRGLHQIAEYVQNTDYENALKTHTLMVSRGNFTEISSFMPGIKVLVQLASQNHVKFL